MNRLRYAAQAGVLLALVVSVSGNAQNRFVQKLSVEKQPVHVLRRLTFGPRPGDLEQVRRLGIEKWIDQQLHPAQIADNPILATKLQPLSTLELTTWQILEQYPQVPPALMFRPAFTTLPPQQMSRMMNGSMEERLRTLASLDAGMRRRVLASIPPQILEDLPADIRMEADNARKMEQEERQKEMRRLMPPLNELLSPDQMRLARMGTQEEKLALLGSFDSQKRSQVIRALGPRAFADLPDLRREAMAASQPQQFVNAELIENKLYRAIYSNRQLEEVLVDFWMNHFNVFNGKGPGRALLTSYERDAIRPHVLGRFKDMLLATARHPAMLFYLDNWQSQSPREDLPLPPGGRRPGLNENYARELMELHTMGVDSGYTQEDILAVARAFSGWTIYDLNRYAEFQFNPAGHDRKEKVILGRAFPPGRGEQDGLDVIDLLSRHPATAKFISKKLAQRFVADDPPQQLIDRMAATFTKTDGDLRAALQTLFSSVEFLSEGAWQSKLKSPLEMTVSSIRALNADVTDTFVLAQRIADLGQPLYGKVEPTGYPNTSDAWTNTASLLGRINFATALAAGQIAGIAPDISRFNFKDPAAVAGQLLSAGASASMVAAMEKGIEGKEATPSLLVTLVLSSPDFQRR